MTLRLLPLLAAALVLVWPPVPATAQNSSIQVLEAPAGPSSGEVLPAADEAAPPPPPCGSRPISIARMQWPTAALLAQIHAGILDTAFGCEVHLQEGDLAATGSSMGATGQPAVAPELWVARIPEIWNAAITAQKVRQAGPSYDEPVFEGWFVPDFAVAAWPDLITVEGLKAHAAELTPGRRPRFISCPADWACSVINRNLLRANGLTASFDVIVPANRFELDTLIAEAVGRQEPIVFYYWQPNAILAQFGFKPVDLGAYDKEGFRCAGRPACAAPVPTGFAPDPVVIALSEWVYIEAPQVASYFQRARMPVAEMNAMLQALGRAGGDRRGRGGNFVATRGAVWRPWAGLPAEPAAVAPPGGDG
ncbi:MAG: glycine betaine ABC transporter substrate-binding protein [Thiobacillus sp.]|uniref:glycine betaine ABC transporter substrate-binding protein n=1 Tax=Thiobacillus sp. TaxID=924 RepID=UPI002893B34C|nr:glycine betaine ABC transporter substrate-binding protein [Thiobacillus sp.]MDT3707337.1 glycine betaine ABC transporter substrate-binding protein [Thiobacillus sp.]